MNRKRALFLSFLATIPAGVAVLAGAALPPKVAASAATGAGLGPGTMVTLAAGTIIALAMALLVRGMAPAAAGTLAARIQRNSNR